VTIGLAATVIPGCEGCIYDLVCPLFPAASAAQEKFYGKCPTGPPPRQRDHRVSAKVVEYTDPPGVPGTWSPSASSYAVHGVLVYNGLAALSACFLPPVEQSICQAMMSSFERRYTEAATQRPHERRHTWWRSHLQGWGSLSGALPKPPP